MLGGRPFIGDFFENLMELCLVNTEHVTLGPCASLTLARRVPLFYLFSHKPMLEGDHSAEK